MNWHATRRRFPLAVVRGMARADSGSGAQRILTDDELRAVWKAAEAGRGRSIASSNSCC